MDNPDFNLLVDEHYEGLYRFALSLSRREAEASDLTQQTFLRWATKGHQLRDKAKAKTWLYTTLHREFLSSRRRYARFPHVDIDEAGPELPGVEPSLVEGLDAGLVMEALMEVDELYRAPLSLFYLEEHSYLEIAEILDIPMGTVMSRLSRGRRQLRDLLVRADEAGGRKVIRFRNEDGGKGERHG